MAAVNVEPPKPVLDTVSESRQPFGLPLGSIRGVMSLFICGFFWLVLLWPGEDVVRPLLAHFFLLALVFMAFASSPRSAGEGEGSPTLPWLLRLLFVGGSIAVVGFTLFSEPSRLSTRLTPDVSEFREWWAPYLAIMGGGFAVGLFIRFILGRESHWFQQARAWLSVVGLLMLALEIGLFVAITSAQNKPDEFLRYWQAFELALVSAYFGTRA